MTSDVTSHCFSSKTKNKNLLPVFSSLTKDFAHTIKDNKANALFLILFSLTPFFYELLGFIINIPAYDTYLRTSHSYFVLSDYLTFYSQKYLGVFENPQSLIGIFTAYFYTFGFLILSATAFVMLVVTLIRQKKYRRREPYVYIAIIIIMFIIDILGYFLFPTAPPVRVVKDFFYRISIFPYGDSLVAIKYNSIPSGHIYALTVPYLVAKAENYRIWKYIFGSGLIFTSWVVLLTGDHYFIDVSIAYFLCILLFAIFTTIYDYMNKSTTIVPKKVVMHRILSLLITLGGLIVISIITFEFISYLFLLFQLICVIIIWPLLVLTTNTDGLLNGDKLITRSLWIDITEGFNSIRKIIEIKTYDSKET